MAHQHCHRLVIEPAAMLMCSRCSSTRRAFHCPKCATGLCLGAPARPCQVHGQCRGPQGPRASPYHHPFHGGVYRHGQAGGRGFIIPRAAVLAPLPWGLCPPGGNLSGKWRGRRYGRGFCAMVILAAGTPPACWRCSRQQSAGRQVRNDPLNLFKELLVC
ncbi:hypothetical protein NDU88_003429 [Pleurodeles waltl]|uniref:Uncharacterized protein n=1 Tax=Pleurodeles waltl TaxID=8319 RepID=A0AAV7M6Z4_PLEWA|nr:hypothetical protein NDU88_003429 [Pleurodeles waltl]